MKQITIFFSDSASISIDDITDEAIEEYTVKLSKILESNNVTVLHTSSSSIIIRPNVISAVKVSNVGEPQKEKPIENESIEIPQDTITD